MPDDGPGAPRSSLSRRLRAGRRAGSHDVCAERAGGDRDGSVCHHSWHAASGSDEVTVLAPGEDARAESDRPARELTRFGAVLEASGLKTVRWLAPSVEQAGSHMEIVRAAEAEWLLGVDGDGCGSCRCSESTLGRGAPSGSVADRPCRRLVHRGRVASCPISSSATGCQGTNGPSVVRCWRRFRPGRATRAVVDDIGNIMVEAGPQGACHRLHGSHGRSGLRDRVDCPGRDGRRSPRREAPSRRPGKARRRSCISIRKVHRAPSRDWATTSTALEGQSLVATAPPPLAWRFPYSSQRHRRRIPARCRRGLVWTPKVWPRAASSSACR